MKLPALPQPAQRLSLLIVLASVGAALCTGCSSTQPVLRHLDRDIPPEVVQQYRESPKGSIERRDNFFLPLLASSKSQLTRTDSGFHALRKNHTVLGLFTSMKEDARYGESGTLLQYNYEGDLVTGLLHGRKLAKTRQDSSYRYDKTWSTLWGLIHFNDESVE